MRVLFVTTNPLAFNTSSTIQNIAIIKGIIESGNQVHVLTTPHYTGSPAYDPSLNDIYGDCPTYCVQTTRLFELLSGNRPGCDGDIKKVFDNLKKRVRDYYWRWAIYDGLKTAADNICQVSMPNVRYDIIISSSEPRSSHLLAEAYICRHPQNRGRWIQYYGDPMFLDITNKTKGVLLPWRIKNEEVRLLSLADEVIYVSPLTYRAQKRLYPDQAGKMRFLPLAYPDIKKYRPRPAVSTPVLGYFGSYNSKIRNILPLYEAACRFSFQLRIAGAGNLQLYSTENVEILGRVSYSEVERLEEDTDILVCVCNREGTQIPGKLYYYAATNRPVLVILDGRAEEIQHYLEPYRRFFFCRNTPDDIARAVCEIMDGLPDSMKEPSPYFTAGNISSGILEKGASFPYPEQFEDYIYES